MERYTDPRLGILTLSGAEVISESKDERGLDNNETGEDIIV